MTVDTSTAAITDRCQHLDHCAHDGKSEDAARMMALLSERDEWMSAFGHFLSEIPLQDVLGASGSVQDAIDYFKTAIAERDALRDQLAAARNEALEKAAYQAKHACLVPPDGGSPTAEEVAVCDEAERRILALKSTTPAPKASDSECPSCGEYDCGECECECDPAPCEVTVQEAARVLLDVLKPLTDEDARGKAHSLISYRNGYSRAISDISALAQEGHSDE